MARTKGRSAKQFKSGHINPIARFSGDYQKAQQLHQSGYLSEAEKIYQEILKHIPDNPDCLHYLGLIYFQKGDDEKADLYFKKSIKSANNPVYLSNYGLLLRKQLKYEQALSLYEKAVKLQPDYAEAWYNLGVTYTDLGNLELSEQAYKKAISLKSNYIKAFFNLAGVQEMQGRSSEAEETIKRIQAISPDNYNLYYNLGIVLQRFGGSENISKALAYYRQALEIEPDSLETLIALARLQAETNKPELALTLYDKILNIEPEYHEIKIERARCLVPNGEVDLAEQECRKILEYSPDNISVMLTLGNVATIKGNFSEAEAIFNKILTYDEYHNGAYGGLTQCKKTDSNNKDFIKKLELAAEKKKTAVIYYALGKVYSEIGRYDDSFNAYKKANDSRNKRIEYNRHSHTKLIDSYRTVFTRELIDKLQPHGHSSDVPIFILGTPRSGTTLTEQIISSHPSVSGAGELKYISQLTTNKYSEKDKNKRYPFRVEFLSHEDIINDANTYLESIQKFKNGDNILRVTDKMPGNFMHIGYISILFPNAKIIHCKRNPLDACLSMYFQNFESQVQFSFDLENLGYWYKDYIHIMEDWKSLFGDRILDVQYDDTVNDTETMAKKLIEFCELEWDEQCIEFHKSKREVRTASVWQVRQPIYKSSLERWRRYDEHIGVLKEILDGYY